MSLTTGNKKKNLLYPFIPLCMPLQSTVQQGTQILKIPDDIFRAIHYPLFERRTDKLTNGWWAFHIPKRSVFLCRVSIEILKLWFVFYWTNQPWSLHVMLVFHAARSEAMMLFLLSHFPVSVELIPLLEAGILASLTYVAVRR